ncbi:MAG: hypothetical protein HMLKMBBP_03533 [Planctomycetes bacterium]|nr:hypothetical protein [Planctomycetota bacterium]
MTRRAPAVVAFVAAGSGAGKTTLLARVVRALRRRGLRVASVKRSHHDVELDPAGKDSRRHRDAGADPVMLAGPRRATLFLPSPRDDLARTVAVIRAARPDVDLVLIEGGRDLPRVRRIEVVASGGDVTCRGRLLAVAADHDVSAPRGVPVLRRSDAAGIARIVAGAAAGRRRVRR